jgi:hypothetical protein
MKGKFCVERVLGVGLGAKLSSEDGALALVDHGAIGNLRVCICASPMVIIVDGGAYTNPEFKFVDSDEPCHSCDRPRKRNFAGWEGFKLSSTLSMVGRTAESSAQHFWINVHILTGSTRPPHSADDGLSGRSPLKSLMRMPVSPRFRNGWV